MPQCRQSYLLSIILWWLVPFRVNQSNQIDISFEHFAWSHLPRLVYVWDLHDYCTSSTHATKRPDVGRLVQNLALALHLLDGVLNQRRPLLDLPGDGIVLRLDACQLG